MGNLWLCYRKNKVVGRDPENRLRGHSPKPGAPDVFTREHPGPGVSPLVSREVFDVRYRLFFRFSGSAKAIVLAWVNDAETLWTCGSRTDAHAVFKAMLSRNLPPNEWEALLKEAEAEVSAL